MYICVCNGITERDIAEAAESGATTFKQMSKSLGVAQECGGCARQAKEIFESYKQDSRLDLAYCAA